MSKNYRAELTGLFGDPVDGNPTGAVEEAAYAALDLNFRYITCKVTPAGLKDAIAGMRAIGMRGVNLTMPHKIAVIPYLDECTPAASLIGAVNTVFEREGLYIGENTDGKGFVLSLEREGIALKGKKVAVLGAGGAARAIAMEALIAGATGFHIINRSWTRGKELADALNRHTADVAEYRPWVGVAGIPPRTEILINCTSVGLHPHEDQKPDVDYEGIDSHMTVCDVVFNPSRTAFLEEAARRGARTVTGLGMLASQAALNFSIWTGVEAPLALMEEKLSEELTRLA